MKRSNRRKGGRPPFDPVMMFKILILQALNDLSDERAEFLITDRLSYGRFLGLLASQPFHIRDNPDKTRRKIQAHAGR